MVLRPKYVSRSHMSDVRNSISDRALGKLIKEELKHQVCISNQRIIDQYLTFKESIQL